MPKKQIKKNKKENKRECPIPMQLLFPLTPDVTIPSVRITKRGNTLGLNGTIEMELHLKESSLNEVKAVYKSLVMGL